MSIRFIALATALIFAALPAQAYVGPGLGLGAIGVILGLLFSFVLAFFAFVWLPVKRLFSKRKMTDVADEENVNDGD